MAANFCSNCGEGVTQEDKFCPECGDSLILEMLASEIPSDLDIGQPIAQPQQVHVEKWGNLDKAKVIIGGLFLVLGVPFFVWILLTEGIFHVPSMLFTIVGIALIVLTVRRPRNDTYFHGGPFRLRR